MDIYTSSLCALITDDWMLPKEVDIVSDGTGLPGK